ncbi:MAG: hypothetical protein QOJ01_2063 [Solirubrobacterales bacterium]|jgi:hypothetical protein|nr:hypothetical protein [Solirubrobacterales bacterium]
MTRDDRLLVVRLGGVSARTRPRSPLRLSLEDREEIRVGLHAGDSFTAIARASRARPKDGVPPSVGTVTRALGAAMVGAMSLTEPPRRPRLPPRQFGDSSWTSASTSSRAGSRSTPSTSHHSSARPRVLPWWVHSYIGGEVAATTTPSTPTSPRSATGGSSRACSTVPVGATFRSSCSDGLPTPLLSPRSA